VLACFSPFLQQFFQCCYAVSPILPSATAGCYVKLQSFFTVFLQVFEKLFVPFTDEAYAKAADPRALFFCFFLYTTITDGHFSSISLNETVNVKYHC